MKAIALIIAGTLVLGVKDAVGQNEASKVLDEFDRPVMVRLVRGDVLRVNTDSAFAYNRKAQLLNRAVNLLSLKFDSLNRENAAALARKDSIIVALRQRVALSDSMMGIRDSVVNAFLEVTRIQRQAWDSLHSQFLALDTLTNKSVDNTDRALAYAKRVRITGYLTSGLAGGIIGGVGFKSDDQDKWDWKGFGLGAALGIGINALAMKILR